MDCVTPLQDVSINMLFATDCCRAGAEKGDPDVVDRRQKEKWTKFYSAQGQHMNRQTPQQDQRKSTG